MEELKKLQKESNQEKEEYEEQIKGLRKELDRAIALQKSVDQISHPHVSALQGFMPSQEDQEAQDCYKQELWDIIPGTEPH